MSEIEKWARELVVQRKKLREIRSVLVDYRQRQPFVDKHMAILQTDEEEACYAIGLAMYELERATREVIA